MERELKILLVEDVPADAELELRELHRAGVACVSRRVDNEADFRKQLKEFAPDLILSDYTLPASFDGLKALAIAREECPGIPYVFVSGTIGEERAIEALKRGATDYVLKENLARLAPAVERAIREAEERAARKKAEQDIENQRAFFRTVIDLDRNFIFAKDRQGRFTLANRAVAEAYGTTVEAMEGKTDADFNPNKEEVEHFCRNDLEVMDTRREKFIPEESITEASGRVRWLQTVKRPIISPDGKANMVLGVATDITQRKSAERTIHGLIEFAPDAMLVTDRDGGIVRVNARAEALFGYTREELLGTPVESVVPERLRALHGEHRTAYLADPKPRSMGTGQELMGRRKDGSEFPAEVSLAPLQTDAGLLITAAIRDVTERKIQEEKIRRLSRIYAILSGINSTIVRVKDRRELFKEACRIAVEQGGFKMAWIGLAEPGAMRAEPVAWMGHEQGYLDEVGSSLGNVIEDHGCGGRALREKRPIVANDIETDPQVVFKKEALARGYRSLVVLPLLVDGNAAGILAIYGQEKNLFDQEEMKLLTELAGDISFALEVIGKEEKLNYLAYFDSLTGLANRSLFIDRVNQHVCALTGEASMDAVILLDLERLRNINNSLGRHAGDSLLKQVAERLKTGAPDEGHVARLGADQFGILLMGIRDEADLGRIVEQKLDELLGQPYVVNDHELRVSAKGGIAVFPGDGADSETLVANAEAALTKAKATADKYLFYTSQMNARVSERLALENKLRRALEERQFTLFYQPKVDLQSERIVGLEALIRWNDPAKGLVPPGMFIAILEETGMILEAGKWVMEQAHYQYQQWREKGLDPPRIAVNVSALQIREKNFTFEVRRVVGMNGAHGLDLEITESLIMENIEDNIEKLKAIKAMGANVAIDDFGTGYSSLSYLAKLPVDALKIDRAFINSIAANPDDMAIVSTMIALAHSLSLKVIAEGVETEEQKKLLRLLKCDEMQGYLYSPPVPVEKIEAMLAART